jgi:hypothetical protein
MASNTDPATLRALADRLDAFMPSVAECFLLKYTQPITDAAAALRACADAQERPATRVASMVGLSENIIVLPEAPAAPAAPDAIGDFDALPYEPKREVVPGRLCFLIAPHCFARGLDAIHAGVGWIAWGAWWSVLAWVSTRTDDTEGK